MDRAQGRTPGSNPVDLTGYAQYGYKRTGYRHSNYQLQACNSGEGGSGAKLDASSNKNTMLVLETERLILRHPVVSDVDGMAAFYSDPEVRRYVPDGTMTYRETKEEVE